MKSVARVLAIAGLALAAVLFARENVEGIVDLVIAAGPGLLLAGLFHFVPMVANARAWQRLLPSAQRPNVGAMTWAVWIRESVNGLLPVARVGGEIIAYRALRRHVVGRSIVAASLLADMALSVLSQVVFALLGLGLLFAVTHAPIATMPLLAGVVSMIPLGVGFMLVQRAGALGALTRFLDRVFAGRLGFALPRSLRLDHAIRAVYARRRDVVACFGWQLAAWILGSVEIWLALYFLGQERSILDAIVIEALIQAISSAAFVVPGALGVQEGGFIVIGAALGLDATAALALATARRVRDAVVFFPGLIAWQWVATRNVKPASAAESR
jgi:putative membrane protein